MFFMPNGNGSGDGGGGGRNQGNNGIPLMFLGNGNGGGGGDGGRRGGQRPQWTPRENNNGGSRDPISNFITMHQNMETLGGIMAQYTPSPHGGRGTPGSRRGVIRDRAEEEGAEDRVARRILDRLDAAEGAAPARRSALDNIVDRLLGPQNPQQNQVQPPQPQEGGSNQTQIAQINQLLNARAAGGGGGGGGGAGAGGGGAQGAVGTPALPAGTNPPPNGTMIQPLQAAAITGWFRITTLPDVVAPVDLAAHLTSCRGARTIAQWRTFAVQKATMTLVEAAQNLHREDIFRQVWNACPFR